MMDTPEVRTLKKNFDSLVNAVRPEVSEIARKLFSQNLITQHGFIGIENQMISPDERAVALLLNVLDRIKVDSRNFDIFISILDASPFLSHVAELLRHTRDGMVLHTTGYTEIPIMMEIASGEGETESSGLQYMPPTVSLLSSNPKVTQDEMETTLLRACSSKDLHCVKHLISQGVNVNYQNELGESPLMKAVENSELVQILCENGANVGLCDKDGRSALMHASREGNHKTIEILVEKYHADPNVRDKNGLSALMLACQNGHDQIVKLFLEKYHADPNVRDKDGLSALMLASQNGHYQMVKLFLENYYLDPNAVDIHGKSAVVLARENGHEKVVKMLRKYGVDDTLPMDKSPAIKSALATTLPPSPQSKVKPSLKEALKVLLPIAIEWQNIGVLLELPYGVLQTIEADSYESVHCLREMLYVWLGHTAEPTWTALAEAVELVDARTADEIRQKYIF